MSSTNTTTHTCSGSGLFLLGLLFVGLKLSGHITWSWWLVTMPFWVGIAMLIAFILFIGLGVLAIAAYEAMARK